MDPAVYDTISVFSCFYERMHFLGKVIVLTQFTISEFPLQFP